MTKINLAERPSLTIGQIATELFNRWYWSWRLA